MIDAHNFNDVIVKFASNKYGGKLAEFHDRFSNEFPYKIEGLDSQTYVKNFMDWLIYEKKLPESNKTIVEEYIDEHPEMEESTKEKLIGTMKFISSEFIVLSRNGLNLVIKDTKSGERYNALFQINIPNIWRNSLLVGRVHPFGETYIFAGAFGVHNSPMILDPDIMMQAFMDEKIRDAEAIIIAPYTQLTSMLNKYPSNWVGGICISLGLSKNGKKNEKAKLIQEWIISHAKDIVEKLPQKSRDALKIVLHNDGFVKCGALKDFSDDITFFWETEDQKSDIGLLRLKGLLVIGKFVENGRKYRYALIPSDIREAVGKAVINSTFVVMRE